MFLEFAYFLNMTIIIHLKIRDKINNFVFFINIFLLVKTNLSIYSII